MVEMIKGFSLCTLDLKMGITQGFHYKISFKASKDKKIIFLSKVHKGSYLSFPGLWSWGKVIATQASYLL